MHRLGSSLLRRALGCQRGQVLPWAAFTMLCVMGMGGLVLDVGRIYVARAQLQNSTNAAALAAVGVIYDSNATAEATSRANQYGGSGGAPGSSSASGVMGSSVNTTVAIKCLNLLMPAGETCASNNPQVPNAVQVTQSATIKTIFMPILFGPKSVTVSTTATAAPGQPQPYNIAIVLDATPSMNEVDKQCPANSSYTEFQCALSGVKTLLSASPCAPGYSSCATANANLHVALFSFPGVSTSTVSDDSGAGCGTTPTFDAYSLPVPGAGSYSPITYVNSSGATWTETYEIVPFSSDYFSSTASGNLNTNSALVQAVNGCMTPIKNTTGNGSNGQLDGPKTKYAGITYYASAIYAAQAALVAQQAANPGTKNLIVMLSDGQANVDSGANNFPGQQGYSVASGSVGLASLTGTGAYPDVIDECQQAIKAAQDAADAGTRVVAISYGSEDQGCSALATVNEGGALGTDSTTIVTGRNVAFTAATITPCITMENIASSLKDFYSDYLQSSPNIDKSCIAPLQNPGLTNMQNIFAALLSSLSTPRLVPSSAT